MPITLTQINTEKCRLCNSSDPITLHTLSHGGATSHLCTSCVLVNNPNRFCPICFVVYEDDDKQNQQRVMCLRCPAIAHISCRGGGREGVGGYLCPRCTDPRFSYFKFGPLDRGRVRMGRELGKQLVCAAEISADSMRKAAEIAKKNAETKAWEAIEARRKAKEAVDEMARLMAGEEPSGE